MRNVLTAIRRRAKRWVGPASFEELDVVRKALKPGLLVDVGAHHGSTSEPFVRSGWRVIAVEPDPQNRSVLQRWIGALDGVVIDPRAVGEVDGERVALYTSAVSSGISSLAPFHHSHRLSGMVETVRLDTLLEGEQAVTVLKTDLEGWDLPALRTFPWSRLHPRAVMSEFEDQKTVALGYSYRDIAEYLRDRGYAVFISEWYPIVEYGRRHRWRRIARYPLEIGPAAWGNVIGVEPDLAGVVEQSKPRLLARVLNG